MTELSIIIPSYNTKNITEECLFFLINNLKKTNLRTELIIVDNASSDGTIDFLKKIQNIQSTIKNLKIVLIFNKKNLGYSKANNKGLALAQGRYVLFLNSDVLIKNVNFYELISFLDIQKKIGVLTIKVLLPNGKIDFASHRGFPTPWRSFCYFLGLERLFSKIPLLNMFFGGYHLIHLNINAIHEIDSPSGAFFLTRKCILDKIGGFDENFFMYGEDLDLSFRIKMNGFKIIYYPFYDVIHLKYSSGLKKNDRIIKKKTKKYFYEAMKIFYKKHYEKKYSPIMSKLIYYLINMKIEP